jgi:hypothetical protein
MVAEDRKAKDQPTDVSVDLVLIRHKRHRKSGIVMVKACHPSAIANNFGSSNLENACQLDLVLTLAEDLYHDRAAIGQYPPPTWRSVCRKASAALYTAEEVKDETMRLGLSMQQASILVDSDRHLRSKGRRLDVSRLPAIYRKLWASLSLAPSNKGSAIDPQDLPLSSPRAAQPG